MTTEYETRSGGQVLVGAGQAGFGLPQFTLVRRAVLDMKTENAQQVTKLKLEQWKGRLKPAAKKHPKAAGDVTEEGTNR